MRAMRTALAALLLLLATPALAEEGDAPPANWDEYQGALSLSCAGPEGDTLPKPDVRDHKGYQYVFLGASAKVKRIDGPQVPGEVRLGVISGIKELDKATRATLDTFIARFKAEKVEGLLIGGDSAENESDLEDIFAYLAAFDLPTYVVIGNWESRAPYNRALRSVSKEHPNMINMDFARRVDGEGFDVIALGGYLDKAFVKGSGACVYKPGEPRSLVALAKQANDPVVLLMHGPPRQSGKDAIDYVPGAGNVGDKEVAAAIAEAKIPFGVHGHILEAGGKATDALGKVLPEKKFHKALFVNPGPVNSLPWKLNSGQTCYGMAALLTIKGKEAKFELLKAAKQDLE